MDRPLLGITMGDPTGVGPEVIVGAWHAAAAHHAARLVVLGRAGVLRRAVSLLNSQIQVVDVAAPEEIQSGVDILPCISCGNAAADRAPPAAVDARGGQAAYDALLLATELALSQRLDGVVTAPLNKTALRAAGHVYPGHTELLTDLCGAGQTAMMLYLNDRSVVHGRVGLGVVHVTLHMALRDIFQQLNTDAIRAKIELADTVIQSFLDDLGESRRPRLAVCALNPHAGETGLFGDEEQRIISPAVRSAEEDGLNVQGPFPTDTLMMRAAKGEFDAVVAMYHDQGHIALKLLGLHRAVNITLGLPIVRTSVAHGTAFDLAWQGRAETAGMLEAIRVAAQLARHRGRSPVVKNHAPSVPIQRSECAAEPS